MRDPKRIRPILELLEEVWSAAPDLRLGQLLIGYNIFKYNEMDIFQQDDNTTKENLELVRSSQKKLGGNVK